MTMQTVWLYLVTGVVFLGLDMIGLRVLMRPLFEAHVGDLLARPLRLGPAAVFYLFYVAGLLWLISVPAMQSGQPLKALLGGMVLGALCYGTYEFTNYATLARWSMAQVAVDLVWGTVLTGFAAWAGVAVMLGRVS